MDSGTEFQSFGPSTEKALSPLDLGCDFGTHLGTQDFETLFSISHKCHDMFLV